MADASGKLPAHSDRFGLAPQGAITSATGLPADGPGCGGSAPLPGPGERLIPADVVNVGAVEAGPVPFTQLLGFQVALVDARPGDSYKSVAPSTPGEAEGEEAFPEGKVLYRRHRVHERNADLVRRA